MASCQETATETTVPMGPCFIYFLTLHHVDIFLHQKQNILHQNQNQNIEGTRGSCFLMKLLEVFL